MRLLALLEALSVEQIAVAADPWVGLGPDPHEAVSVCGAVQGIEDKGSPRVTCR